MALSKAGRGAVCVVLLLCSNCFMNAAWYTHLKFENWTMPMAIFISWGIALPEYSLQVPANRIGHISRGGPYTAPQLKIISEFLSLTTFAIFSTIVLKEKLRWADLGAFVLIFAGVMLSLLTKPATTKETVVELSPPLPPPLTVELEVQLDMAAMELNGSKYPYLVNNNSNTGSDVIVGNGTSSDAFLQQQQKGGGDSNNAIVVATALPSAPPGVHEAVDNRMIKEDVSVVNPLNSNSSKG